jgi:RNA polymerase sigma-70 factor (ECF subfamily)
VLSNSDLLKIHNRLLKRDPVAGDEFWKVLIDPLLKTLGKIWPDLIDDREHVLVDAATDAILEHIQNPDRYNHALSQLFTFITLAARRNVVNALKKLGARMEQEIPYSDFELLEGEGNNEIGGERDDTHAKLEWEELFRGVQEAFNDDKDRQAARLILSKVRSTEVFADIYGLERLSGQEKRRVVKQHKDRIKYKLKKHGVDLGDA